MFVDVTWGAGGSTSDLTTEICINAHRYVGLEVQMHLTCTNMPIEKFKKGLAEVKEVGMRNILALRGGATLLTDRYLFCQHILVVLFYILTICASSHADPPRGEEWKAIEGGFAHAVDLVRYIRQEHGDWFCIGVAGYPEKHVDCDTCGSLLIVFESNLYLH